LGRTRRSLADAFYSGARVRIAVSFPYLRAVFGMDPTWSTPAEFAVLVTLANFADKNGIAYPSQQTIGRRVGLQLRHVRNVTQALEAKGLIEIKVGEGPRRFNVFRLTLDPAMECRGETGADPAMECRGRSGNGNPPTPAIYDTDPGNLRHGPRQPSA